jgi:hypothetical protein
LAISGQAFFALKVRRSYMCRVADDSASFRKRAGECRELARRARDEAARRELTEIANELEAEARKIDAELRQQPHPKIELPPQ